MNNRKLHIDTYWNGFATDFQSDGKAVFFVQNGLLVVITPTNPSRTTAEKPKTVQKFLTITTKTLFKREKNWNKKYTLAINQRVNRVHQCGWNLFLMNPFPFIPALQPHNLKKAKELEESKNQGGTATTSVRKAAARAVASPQSVITDVPDSQLPIP